MPAENTPETGPETGPEITPPHLRVAAWLVTYAVLFSASAALFIFFATADFVPLRMSDGVLKTLLIGLFAQNISLGGAAAYLAAKRG